MIAAFSVLAILALATYVRAAKRDADDRRAALVARVEVDRVAGLDAGFAAGWHGGGRR